MNVTQILMELDPSLELHDEGEWNNTNSAYRAFNSGGIECETGEFLYSLIRLIKPQNILETGTHLAIGASYMGLGLKDNFEIAPNYSPKGHLDTIEFLPEIHRQAKERIHTMYLEDFVSCHLGDVANFVPQVKYQLILLDTEPQTRFAELIKFYPYLEEGGFVFIHDLHRHMHQIDNADHGFAWPYGRIPQEMTELVTSGNLRPFHFSTPRGLTGFYKVADQDYPWI